MDNQDTPALYPEGRYTLIAVTRMFPKTNGHTTSSIPLEKATQDVQR